MPDPLAGWQRVTDEPWDWTHWDAGHPKSQDSLSNGCGYFGDWSRWNDLPNHGAYHDILPIACVMASHQVWIPGDMNLDGQVNGLDVDPFINAVLSEPFNPYADRNGDGVVTGLDVDPFVTVVAGSGTAATPEPSTIALVLITMAVVAQAAGVAFAGKRRRQRI